MKICFLAISGLNNPYDYKFLKKLNDNNYKVKCIVYTVEKIELSEEYKNLKNIEYINFLPINRFYKIFGPLNLFYKVYQLKKLIKEFKPDILHCSYVRLEGYIGALTGFHPFLLMPVGTDILLDAFTSLWTFIKTRFTIRCADMLTCDSEYQKEFVVKIGNIDEDKVITFPWGVEQEIFFYKPNIELRKQLDWNDKIILIINRNFIEIYGHQYFIEAFKLAIQENKNLRLILIGRGHLKEKILYELDSFAKGYYKYIGYCSPFELAQYLNASDIYVNASLSDGTSCSMLEAMACGLPVITTNIFVNYEWIK
ncbi:MAG TPA: glycosyltransferase family 4 protein, partial [bacterium]|nr:glycosyltransferase family 4 protein [bacterium]